MYIEPKCKHGCIIRNCYKCHLEYIYPIELEKLEYVKQSEKTQLDTLSYTISELKIRISKLEEYKRLQNIHNVKQYDENMAIYKHFKNIDENMKLLEETQVAHNKRFNEKISEIEKLISKNISSDSTKTSNLTFEEAITAFKSGKNIRFNDGMSETLLYKPMRSFGYAFEYDKIIRDHWEIVE